MVNAATPSAETAAQAVVGTEVFSATTVISMAVGVDRANQIRPPLNVAEYVVNAFQRVRERRRSDWAHKNLAPGGIGAI